MDTFYEEIPPFTVFDELTDARHYRAVPGAWWVVVSDVRGSTRAIEEGRYKDVNTLGAATISCVQNALGRQLPFVFGGDGATLLAPPGGMEHVKEALRGLQRLSQAQYGMELRVALVPVQKLLDSGHQLEVARFVQPGGRALALFRGDGVQAVEWWMKLEQSPFHLEPGPASTPLLNGLSCHWQPIPSARGHILSILVMGRTGHPEQDVAHALEALRDALGEDVGTANPLGTGTPQHRTLADCLQEGRRYQASPWTWSRWRRTVLAALGVLVYRLGFLGLLFDKERYRASFRTHSDFRKYDGTLRMVLDCSDVQAAAVRGRLEELRREGRIHYGIHASEEALMTCMVVGLADGQHVHLVDGSQGGYAVAARQLKAQVAGLPG
ncbi:MAG: hypothetical protein RL653_2518 [Pseudomonadota bacterium]|jgi:hypothetical protein